MPTCINRPRNTILYAPHAIIAQLHISHAAAVDMERVFPFDPVVPGAATRAETTARAWIDKMEQDLGLVRYPTRYRPGEFFITTMAIVVVYILLRLLATCSIPVLSPVAVFTLNVLNSVHCEMSPTWPARSCW